MKIGAFIFAGTLYGAGMLYIGLHIGEARSEKPIVLTKTCPIPAQTTRWVCDSAEMREYRNVCLRRMRAVKP